MPHRHQSHSPPDHILFSKEDGLPRGTTDRVMERLFPTQRSAVDLSDERRLAVRNILEFVGYYDLTGDEDGIHA